MNEKSMSIIGHLQELRRVLVISIISIIPASAVGWHYREHLLSILVLPLDRLNYKLVYISPTEAFLGYIQIALFAGVVMASPIILWQLWSFVKPALRPIERKYMVGFSPVAIFLFITGVVFGYIVVFNYGIQFLLGFGGEGVDPMLSLARYLSFTFWFLIPFGFIFELPLVIMLLTRIGLVTPAFLARNRKFALLIIFVLSAIITPTTDVVTLLAMAGPMYILYEFSIWISRFIKPRSLDDTEEEPEEIKGEEEKGEEEKAEEEKAEEEKAEEEKAVEEKAVEEKAEEEKAADVKAEQSATIIAEEVKQEVGDKKLKKEDNKLEDSAEDSDNFILFPFEEEDPKTKRLEEIYRNITEKGKSGNE